MSYEKDHDDNDLQAVLDAGMALGTPHPLDEDATGVAFVLPRGATLQQVDLEKYLPKPRRKTGNVTLATAQSFIDWVNRNKTPEAVIYAKESDTSFLAIFNGHHANSASPFQSSESKDSVFEAGASGWGDYTSRYNCPVSDEWKRWHGKSQHAAEPKKGMPHAEFLQFIEDNLLDIKTPASGQLLASLGRFEARRDVKFVSGKRLDNGDVAFAYSEDTVQVTEGQSDLRLPSMFTIAIPVFKGGAVYEIDANLRYRATPGSGLTLWFELVRPHKSLEHAFTQVGADIAAGTSVPMFST